MDANKKILLPAEMFFDTIIYFFYIAASVHEGEEMILLEPEEFLRDTEPKQTTEGLGRFNVSYFRDFKKAQRRFQYEFADAMAGMIGEWASHLSLDPVLFKEFNSYAKETYGLDIPLEFRGKRPNLTLVLNRQPKK